MHDGHERGAWWEPKVLDKGMDEKGIAKERALPRIHEHKYIYLAAKVNTRIEHLGGFL